MYIDVYTITSNNIEIIQVQLNGISITNYCKPPNEKVEFGLVFPRTPIEVHPGGTEPYINEGGMFVKSRDAVLTFTMTCPGQHAVLRHVLVRTQLFHIPGL